MTVYQRVFSEAIKDNLDALNENDFDTIYDRLREDGMPTCEVTKLFLLAGVDPTSYLTEIPNNYAKLLPLITKVKCYNDTTHLLKIGFSAFENCPNLVSVELARKMEISQLAFHGCKKLETVIYPYTLNEFNMFVTAWNSAFDDSTIIKFSDCEKDWKTIVKLRKQL